MGEVLTEGETASWFSLDQTHFGRESTKYSSYRHSFFLFGVVVNVSWP